MNRESSLLCLATALQQMLDDDAQAEEIVRRLPPGLHQDAKDVVVYVWHFVADADVRRKDPERKQDQEQQMRDLIAALGRGSPREVLLEYTFL